MDISGLEPLLRALQAAVIDFDSLEALYALTGTLRNSEPLVNLINQIQELTEECQLATYRVLLSLASKEQNLVLLNETTLSTDLLRIALECGSSERTALLKRLFEAGMSTEATKLLLNLLNNADANCPLWSVAEHAVNQVLPPHYYFDTGRVGYASIEFEALPRPFPPLQAGYTFFTWLNIERCHSEMHVTLFGVLDQSQKSFTMAYIEKTTNCLILQTGPKSSVRFSKHFEPGVWYNIAISHKRPRTTSSARAFLYINGECVETLRCAYPASPPAGSSMQGFIGTLRDFSPAGTASVSYSLGQTILVGQILLPELLQQYFRLGIEYAGNYQDYLASYMTYEASSELKAIYDKPDSNNLKSKNSENMPETALILSIAGETFSTKNNCFALSRDAKVYLAGLNKADIGKVVLNKAIPNISVGLTNGKAIGIISGDVTGVRPTSFCSNIYKVGGVGTLLHLVAIATKKSDLLLRVKLCLGAISQSFLNSEDFEKVHGYEILARLLKEKSSECLCPELLVLILEFVGIRKEILNNPMAYRFLLADFSLWSRAREDVQRDHLNQFLIFSNSTHYKAFNNSRMGRMNIVKKFLHVLRLGVAPNLLPHYISALKGLLINNFSTEVVRSVSSFVIYMLHRKGIQRRYSIRVNGTDVQNLAAPNEKQNTGLAVLRMLEELLVDRKSSSNIFLDKFAYTITNRWTLLLLSHTQTRPHALKILARLLISQGRSYVNKFGGKNDGFVICEALLETSGDQLWTELLGIAFGTKDITYTKTENRSQFIYDGDISSLEVVNPEILPVLMVVLRKRSLSLAEVDTRDVTSPTKHSAQSMKSHTRTASLEAVMGSFVAAEPLNTQQLLDEGHQLESLVSFLAQIFDASVKFRDFCSSDNIAVHLIRILFCLVCDVVDVSPQQELQSKDSILTFDREATLIEGVISQGIVKTRPALTSVQSATNRVRASSLRRSSSFVLLDPVPAATKGIKGLKLSINGDETKSRALKIAKPLAEQLFALLTSITSKGVLTSADLSIQDIRCMPPGFIEHQIYFWSIFQQRLIAAIRDTLQHDYTVLHETKVVHNFAKFTQGLFSQMEDGIFVGGPQQLFVLIAEVLEYLRRPEVNTLKSIKLCDAAIKSMKRTLEKLTLLRLCDATEASIAHGDGNSTQQTSELLNHLLYYQELFFHDDPDSLFLSLVIYHLYNLTSASAYNDIKMLSLDVMRSIALLQHREFLETMGRAKAPNLQAHLDGWAQILESDSHTFMLWIAEHRAEFSTSFKEALEVQWNSFTMLENKASAERLTEQARKRREHLKARVSKAHARHETIARYEASSSKWADNVVRVESAKNHKSQQDETDHTDYIAAEWEKIHNSVTGLLGTFERSTPLHWRLDPTECALRQRRKLRPMTTALTIEGKSQLSDTQTAQPAIVDTLSFPSAENEFEIVEQPSAIQSDDLEEDKNRKVLRSLDIGDAVLEVYNISRISGLSAIEGLLIIGRQKIYLIDGYFNRKDNEICDVWDETVQAERDPILQVIAGQNVAQFTKPHNSVHGTKIPHECRSFSYEAVTSATKRQFLFRDVAIEIFFQDGRNYLITTLNKERDTIHRRLLERTRLGLKDELSQKDTVATLSSFGAKFFNVFTNSPAAQATARWERREISNFEYLMIVNGLAGRSFNDLTQYPVMPWVLADYTSEHLDLSNPASFRDLSKNMGSQNAERRKDFQERYDSFAGAGIEETKAFHFGTHHSSAMVVCSYLIRLIPFVESYLLLQGGHFDHPDRLFASIKKAWLSASKENMTDVRELTPEWYFLPEFLTNDNHFDFGTLQSTGKRLNHVELPPWANGDAHVFIEKHREALESDYVSAHLHQWIDLIFGYKQLGQAAVDATNVYHALSYHGAIDLDAISDPVQRLATIGIIHNFGQTPRQVFQRPHAMRGTSVSVPPIEVQLAQLSLQSVALDLKHPVSSITMQAGISGNSFARVRLANNPELSAFWANADNSLRIIGPDGVSLGIFPSLHTQPITHCISVSNFLVMGSADTTLSTLKLGPYKNNILSIESQTYLRGHASAISSLAVSATYSIILSGDTRGAVLVHDLNRDQLVREIPRFDEPVCALAIGELSGYLVACSASLINVFTVNGHLLATANLSETQQPIVTASMSASGSILYTGHTSGYSLVWTLKLSEDQSSRDPKLPRWDLKIVRELQHSTRASITAFKPVGARLYTGDSNGKIYTWVRVT